MCNCVYFSTGGDRTSFILTFFYFSQVYVWIYDPVNAKNFMIGLLMGMLEIPFK